MKVISELTLDKLINYYEGLVVADRKRIEIAGVPGDFERSNRMVLSQDKMILGALKCAKANGFTGEG